MKKASKMEISKHNSAEPIKRFFDCIKCKVYLIKYIPKTEKNSKCYKCGNILKEISEKEYDKKIFGFLKEEPTINNNIIKNKNNIIDIIPIKKENDKNISYNSSKYINKVKNRGNKNDINLNIFMSNSSKNIRRNENNDNNIKIKDRTKNKETDNIINLNNNYRKRNSDNIFLKENNINKNIKLNKNKMIANNGINTINTNNNPSNNNINLKSNNIINLNNITPNNYINYLPGNNNVNNLQNNNRLNYINNIGSIPNYNNIQINNLNQINNNIGNNLNIFNNSNNLNNLNNLNNINNLNYYNNLNLLNNTSNQNNLNNFGYINNNSHNVLNDNNNIINLQNNNNQLLNNNILSQNNRNINVNNVLQNKQNIKSTKNNVNLLQNKNNNNALAPFNNNNQTNNNALVSYNNNNNQNSGIHSNDFWQKIDNRKLTNSQNINNNLQNNLVSQNRNNNRRNNDSEQMNQVLDDFFGDFFNNEGPSHQVSSNHMQIRINDPSEDLEPHVYFHSFFSPFGIMSGAFRQNYSSNFGNQLHRLMELIQRGRGGHAHPPASREALGKLKRFPLAERFCQKKNGKLELPNCCICQCEIELGKEIVLLPCGHMYHWDCCLQWLKTNNTCPICRFEIK